VARVSNGCACDIFAHPTLAELRANMRFMLIAAAFLAAATAASGAPAPGAGADDSLDCVSTKWRSAE